MRSEPLVPITLNVVLTLADTEYVQQLPVGTKGFQMEVRGSGTARYAFETGKVAASTAPYGTIKSTQAYESPEKMGWSYTSATDNVPNLYLASSTAQTVVDVTVWKDMRTVAGEDLTPDQDDAEEVAALAINQFHGLDRNIKKSGNLARLHLGKARLSEVRSSYGSMREQQSASVLNLDGVGDFVTVTDHADFDITDTLSVSIWSKNDSATLSGDQYMIGKWLTTGDSKEWLFGISSAEKVIVTLSGDGSTTNVWTSDSTVTTDEWAQYGFVYDGSSLTVFRNGAEIAGSFTSGSLPSSLHNDTSDVLLGATNAGGAGTWAGSLSDARIYNAAISDTEMASLGTWPDLYSATETGLVAHWTCTDQNGDIVQNRESNDKHGVITVNSALSTIRATDKTCPSAGWGNTNGFSQARYFDGSNDYFESSENLDAPSSSFRVELWVLHTATGSTDIILDGRDANNDGFRLVFDGVDKFTTSMDSTTVASNNTYTDTDWHKIVVTWDGADLTLDIDDGNDIASKAVASAWSTTANFRVGEVSFTTGFKWVGYLADLTITIDGVEWAQYLADQEYTSSTGTIIDESGNGRHLTQTGTADLSRIPVGTTADTDIRGLTSQHTGKVPRSPIVNSPCLTFDGVGDYASKNIGARSTSYPQTLRGSFYADTVAAGVDCIATVNDESVDNLYWGVQRSGSNFQVIRRNTTEVATTVGPALTATTWYDYVLRLDSATAFTLWLRTHGGPIREYTQTGLTSVALSTSIDAVALGTKSLNTPANFWDGRLANIVYHDGTAMSDAQAESLLDDPNAVSGEVVLYRCIEGGGDIVNDGSGNENHAVITQNSSLATIWGQTAPADISIVNDGVTKGTWFSGGPWFGSGSRLTSGSVTQLSVSFWINKTIGASTFAMAEFGSSGNRGWSAQFQNDLFRVLLLDPSDVQTTVDIAASISSFWAHVAFVYDGANQTCQLYLNGSPVSNTIIGTVPTALKNNTSQFQLGRRDTVLFNGTLRGVAIEQAVWDDATVAAAKNGNPPSTAWYWRDADKVDHNGIASDLSVNGTAVSVNIPGTVAGAVTHLDKIIEGQDLDEDPQPNNYYANHLQTDLSDTAYSPGDDDEADVRFVRTQALGAPTTQPENDDRLIYVQEAATGGQKASLESYGT